VGLDERERVPLLDVSERSLAATQDDRVNDQPEFVDQTLVQQAGDQRRSADDLDRSSPRATGPEVPTCL
jgi:hypothetical protein